MPGRDSKAAPAADPRSLPPGGRWIHGLAPASLLSLVAGALVPAAFAPWHLYPLAVLSPAVLFYLWLHAAPRRAFWHGYLYGIGMFGIGVSWLHISINLFGGVNFAGSVLLTFLFVAFIALFPACAGYLAARVRQSGAPAALATAAAWTLMEWTRSWIFTGFPWLNLGYSQTDSPLAGMAPVSGIFGISFILALTAACLALLPQLPRRRSCGAGAALVLVWSLSWLAGKIEWSEPTGEVLSVALIQGAVPQALKWQPSMLGPTLELYGELTAPYLDHDLVIWPEAAIPAYYHQVTDYMDRMQVTARDNGLHLVTGIPLKDPDTGRYYNGVVMLGDGVSFYHKRHLVPFGEYLPLDFLLRGVVEYLNIPMSSFSAGQRSSPVLEAGGVRIGVSICYEDTFGEEVIEALPGAAILVNVSNDAWFGDSAAPHQHLQMARMRAAETGRYLLRATNTGVTAIIDEKGRVLQSSPQFVATALSGRAVLFRGGTPYSVFGNYPVVIGILLILAGARVKARRLDVS